jgi:hypothetical protein
MQSFSLIYASHTKKGGHQWQSKLVCETYCVILLRVVDSVEVVALPVVAPEMMSSPSIFTMFSGRFTGVQEEVAETAGDAQIHSTAWSRIHAFATADWGNGDAWRAWLAAKVPDTAKEVWEWAVAALLLVFAVSLVNSIARVQWQLERRPGFEKR